MSTNSKVVEVDYCVHLFGFAQKLKFVYKKLFSNKAIEKSILFHDGLMCVGDTCIFLLNPVIFKKNLLSSIDSAFANNNNAAIIYTNYRKLRIFPVPTFKYFRLPEWSPERFLGSHYVGSVIAIKKERISNSEIAINLENLVELFEENIVGKINHPMYWQIIGQNLAISESHFRSVQNYLSNKRKKSVVIRKDAQNLSITNQGFAPEKISIIIPTRGTRDQGSERTLISHLFDSISKQNSGSSKLEIIVVFDTDTDLDYLEEIKSEQKHLEVKLVGFDPPFNFSKKCNLGAHHASGAVIIFLNDDTSFITPNGLLELAGTAMLPGVGAVGAKLFFADKSIQHGGIVVIHGNVGHAYFKETSPKLSLGDLTVNHEVSGVTGACFVQQRRIWEEQNGWDESFSNSYNDVEYSFRLRDAGYQIIQNNQVELFHYESLTRDPSFSKDTYLSLKEKWPQYLTNDSYFPQYVTSQISKRRVRTFIKRTLRILRLKK